MLRELCVPQEPHLFQTHSIYFPTDLKDMGEWLGPTHVLSFVKIKSMPANYGPAWPRETPSASEQTHLLWACSSQGHGHHHLGANPYLRNYSSSTSVTNWEWCSGDLLCVLLRWSFTACLLTNVRLHNLHLNLESVSSSPAIVSGDLWADDTREISCSALLDWSAAIRVMSFIWKPRWDSKWLM